MRYRPKKRTKEMPHLVPCRKHILKVRTKRMPAYGGKILVFTCEHCDYRYEANRIALYRSMTRDDLRIPYPSRINLLEWWGFE